METFLIKKKTSLTRKINLNSKNVTLYITSIILIIQVLNSTVLSFHIPRYQHQHPSLMRRQDDIDSDGDDELDSGASAPYQNQDDGAQNGAQDGYEDNESDGPYGETPRDEEGQADLERFFDDHLGASEKDGMDKENLPSNIVPISVPVVSPIFLKQTNQANSNVFASSKLIPIPIPIPIATPTSPNNLLLSSESSTLSSYIERDQMQQQQQLPNIETKFIQLPNNKLIITRQSITRGPIYKGGLDLPEIPTIPEHYLYNNNNNEESSSSEKPKQSINGEQDDEEKDSLNANGSEIIATEDEDDDRVYVTKLNNKPFRIEALGGFDPEEDFRDASRDINEPTTSSSSKSRNKHDSRRKSNLKEQEEQGKQKDISFSDPEPDILFNDASETDEVTFDDPYQTDLEAEMHAQAYDKPGTPTNFESQEQADENRPTKSEDSFKTNIPRESRMNSIKRKDHDNDEEGNWVNDGVEDMDIPSQSHQDVILAKAAKQEALARKQAEEEAEADAQQAANQQEPEDPDNQRMDNADYLRDDLKSIDDPDDSSMAK